MPVCKAHIYAGATLAIKNWVGMMSLTDKVVRFGSIDAMHLEYFMKTWALPARVMAQVLPDLNIIDATWTAPTNNYSAGQSCVNTKIILASTDPVALSWYAAKFILKPVADNKTRTDPDYVYTGTPDISTCPYAYTFKNWANYLITNAHLNFTRDSSNISVYGREVLDPMPVELVSFTALVHGMNVKLHWSTASEVQNYGFEVERRSISDGPPEATKWKNIGFLQGAGTSNAPLEYSFSDLKLAPGRYVYRLKQLDQDGASQYSQSVEVEIGTVPKAFIFPQNYPNPFNPRTTIEYQLPVKANVQLEVLNILGQRVATLVNAEQEAGYYQVPFNAKALSSGIYFYRISAGNYVKSQKMLLLR
jgi:hypothetical protein